MSETRENNSGQANLTRLRFRRMRVAVTFFPILILPTFFLGLRGAPGATSKTVIVLRPPQETMIARFTVEIADEPRKWAQGLMNRRSLAAGSGMIFIFPESEVQEFWMKDTLLPLDMLFADGEGKSITIHENAPACLPPRTCPTYQSTAPVLYVLEINGGMSHKKGIRLGDFLQLR